MKTGGATGPLDSALSLIAEAGMGWKLVHNAEFWTGKPCNACEHFEMRMIKANESDSFGHLLPYCNHPQLPGDGGLRTVPNASCHHWRAK